MSPSFDIFNRLRWKVADWRHNGVIARHAKEVVAHTQSQPTQPPVVFFNASTRIADLSLNAAFSLLTSWSLRLAGVPAIHFVCQAGMSHCVLGINRDDPTQPMPCKSCMAQSQLLYTQANVHTFSYVEPDELSKLLENKSVEELVGFEYLFPLPHALGMEVETHSMPLGSLVVPSLRWTLRRHTLLDDEPTRLLLRQYIRSAYNLAREFAAFLESARPQSAVIFNGLMYPEAVARWVAHHMEVRTVAHEVGFQHFSAFFTDGEPTAYPIDIPTSFELSAKQNARLDAYLEERFQGNFTMAGIQFWPEMRGLDQLLLEKVSRFSQIVPVFTNVIYDTSQVHSNVVFSHMFTWLEVVQEIIRSHPETLFIIRAHPDEMRPGTAKQSRESVRDWVTQGGVDKLSNVVFIDSLEYVSSYELIQRAKFVMVYSSSIGLEAALMGKPVLCAGKARYTQYPMVFFPQSVESYHRASSEFLDADEILVPPEFRENARRFLYYQLYRASLPLEEFLQPGRRLGSVYFRSFPVEKLLPENSPTLRVIQKGILKAAPFLLPEDTVLPT